LRRLQSSAPVTLKFGHIRDGGERLRPCLNHALDASLMTFGAAATCKVFGACGVQLVTKSRAV
jgi:hypothetical protein